MPDKKAPPHWLLTEHWGISVDTYNWILKHRGMNKDNTGPATYWNSVGYWGRADQLFESLMDQLNREDPGERSIEEQLQRAYDLATAALKHFTSLLEAEGVSELRPRVIAAARADRAKANDE